MTGARICKVGYIGFNNKINVLGKNFRRQQDAKVLELSRSVVFFSSNFTSNRAITRGILTSIVKLKEKGIPIKRAHLVEANKYLNIVGGAMILDTLTEEEVVEMIDKHLEKVFEFEAVLV